MTRATFKSKKSDMFILLDRVNHSRGLSFELNNAPIYGGWQLTSNNGSSIIKHRVSLKEMLCYLDGMSKAMEICNE
jgi:hypothetical protein|tara:strand:+ start:517 stop:744 length:228 start_codon:yes stop_codon:yes gene_type:complete